MAQTEVNNVTQTSIFNANVASVSDTENGGNTDSFSNIEYRKLERHYIHAETEKKQDHEHEREILEAKLGSMGRFFGHDAHSSKHITFAIIFILFIINFIFTLIFYRQPYCSDFVSKLWEQMFPLITLSLGYIFGREK